VALQSNSRRHYDSPPRHDDSSRIASVEHRPSVPMAVPASRTTLAPTSRPETAAMQSTLTAAFSTTLVAVLLAALPVAPARAGGDRHPARHFDVVNASFDSVTAFAIAPAGSAAFHDVALGEPLQGGLNSITVDVPDGGCLRDVRVTFRNGRTLLYPHIDACRYQGLRLMPRDGRLDPAEASTLAQAGTTSRNAVH
jgi:hypothetical protein